MHIRDEDLELYVLGRLPQNQTTDFEAHLGECGSCEQKLAEAAKFTFKLADLGRRQQPAEADRRIQERVAADEAVSIKAISPLAAGRAEGRVVDVSKSGLKLRVPEFLHPGTMIQIWLRDTIALGEVRYCVAAGAGFHAGVHVQDVFSSATTSHE